MSTKIFVVCFFLGLTFIAVNAQQGRSPTPLKSRPASDNGEPLGLPENSTLIRSNIVDTFSCEGKQYGYYADVDNECQVFHVCHPVTYDDGKTQMFRWSFICPVDTIFNQEHFQCARTELSVPCASAPSFYHLNDEFGKIPERKEPLKN